MVGLRSYLRDSVFTYSGGEAVLTNETAVRFTPPPAGVLTGVVRDRVAGAPVPGAVVSVLDAAGATLRQARTGGDGSYRVEVPLGRRQARVTAPYYETATGPVVARGPTTSRSRATSASTPGGSSPALTASCSPPPDRTACG